MHIKDHELIAVYITAVMAVVILTGFWWAS